MNGEVIFWTQIGSLVGYIGSLFFLYRVMVSQKDSTIETLKSQCEFLKMKLTEAEKNNPDALLERLNHRKDILEKEFQMIGQESTAKRNELEGRIKELGDRAKELEQEVFYVNEVLAKYSCPHCKAPLIERGIAYEAVEHNGREYEVDREWESFECGFKQSDGNEIRPCPNA